MKPTKFIEIANDFANPLDIVREAISNAYDAGARSITMLFSVEAIEGESVFKIEIIDDGSGMDQAQIKAFFDLGNSTHKADSRSIGEKGHGTKIYFSSKRILVTTQQNGSLITAETKNPYSELHSGRKPKIVITTSQNQGHSGTKIEIWGYNSNRRDKFTHHNLRDHILWFSRHGGIDVLNPDCALKDVKLYLKGLDSEEKELVEYGHIFPKESDGLEKLFKEFEARAPDHYCKRTQKILSLKNHPEVKIQLLFSIEGKAVKYDYNPMIRRPGYSAPKGAYTNAGTIWTMAVQGFYPCSKKERVGLNEGPRFD